MIYGKHGKILALVLAGGRGERIMPLTKYRAKPAVPFAAKYRIVDFALSNLINSSIFSIYVLVQFKSQSLNDLIERGWQFGGALRDRDLFVTVAPAQMWSGEHWYQGTCDAVFQNLHLVTLYDADHVLIFAADHIYKMDVEQMLQFHVDTRADVTVAANVVPTSEAYQLGASARTSTTGSSTSSRSPRFLLRFPVAPASATSPWATTSSPGQSSKRHWSKTLPTRTAPTISDATFCRSSSRNAA